MVLSFAAILCLTNKMLNVGVPDNFLKLTVASMIVAVCR